MYIYISLKSPRMLRMIYVKKGQKAGSPGEQFFLSMFPNVTAYAVFQTNIVCHVFFPLLNRLKFKFKL